MLFLDSSLGSRVDPAYRTNGVVLELESCRARTGHIRLLCTASLAAIYSPCGISLGDSPAYRTYSQLMKSCVAIGSAKGAKPPVQE